MAILVFLCIGMAVALAGAQNVTLSESSPGNPISIDLSYPEEGDVVYFDVVPAYLTVEGKIFAREGIRNITITNGVNSVECDKNYGTYYNLSCKFPLHLSMTNHTTIIVTDMLGNSASETRNFTTYGGIPPPDAVAIYGNVLDLEGNPVSNATIILESSDIHGSFTVITRSRPDGGYQKWTHGDIQKITVEKTGYSSVYGSYIMQRSNRINFTLSPLSKSTSGFDAVLCLSGISLSLIVVFLRKKDTARRKL
ncbi:MAG: hypothetical protein LUQ50_02390 [Methanospirillum sp.]|uniref:hypothetical protein n=1 Tax=Methanospirillum sp. TaxID=45200 RepID=UPI002375872A|nr:hypothetical protein [Methanospirillum sp.]MDD1727903.1 hypothetical protein [Methanospirillum sp.]